MICMSDRWHGMHSEKSSDVVILSNNGYTAYLMEPYGTESIEMRVSGGGVSAREAEWNWGLWYWKWL